MDAFFNVVLDCTSLFLSISQFLLIANQAFSLCLSFLVSFIGITTLPVMRLAIYGTSSFDPTFHLLPRIKYSNTMFSDRLGSSQLVRVSEDSKISLMCTLNVWLLFSGLGDELHHHFFQLIFASHFSTLLYELMDMTRCRLHVFSTSSCETNTSFLCTLVDENGPICFSLSSLYTLAMYSGSIMTSAFRGSRLRKAFLILPFAATVVIASISLLGSFTLCCFSTSGKRGRYPKIIND